MATFKIEVELDYVEGESLDQEILDLIVDKIIESLKEDTKKYLTKTIESRANSLLDQWILENLEAFSDRAITRTDQWGDTIEHHDSLRELFKAKFDAFLDAKVDKDGKEIQGCTYGNQLTRIDFLLEKMAKDKMKYILDSMDRKIAAALNKHWEEEATEKIVKHTTQQVKKLKL